MRVWNYERKLQERKEEELAKKCRMELQNRMRKGKVMGVWNEERKEYMRKRGWDVVTKFNK